MTYLPLHQLGKAKTSEKVALQEFSETEEVDDFTVKDGLPPHYHHSTRQITLDFTLFPVHLSHPPNSWSFQGVQTLIHLFGGQQKQIFYSAASHDKERLRAMRGASLAHSDRFVTIIKVLIMFHLELKIPEVMDYCLRSMLEV